jgi:CheY-like chemotaxis protein
MVPTILLVDDDYDIRTVLRLVLEHAGYSVLVAADGEEALDAFKQHQDCVALLLTDVAMPRMNGVDLADHILKFDSHVPVVFMSGSMMNADRGFGCIAKPFKPAELIGRVRNVLEERELRMKSSAAS